LLTIGPNGDPEYPSSKPTDEPTSKQTSDESCTSTATVTDVTVIISYGVDTSGSTTTTSTSSKTGEQTGCSVTAETTTTTVTSASSCSTGCSTCHWFDANSLPTDIPDSLDSSDDSSDSSDGTETSEKRSIAGRIAYDVEVVPRSLEKRAGSAKAFNTLGFCSIPNGGTVKPPNWPTGVKATLALFNKLNVPNGAWFYEQIPTNNAPGTCAAPVLALDTSKIQSSDISGSSPKASFQLLNGPLAWFNQLNTLFALDNGQNPKEVKAPVPSQLTTEHVCKLYHLAVITSHLLTSI
jgi:hypothetical protein